MEKDEAQKTVIAQIRKIRYGSEGKDYFWINDMHPRMIMHPYRSDLEGKDITDYTDSKGKQLFVEFVKVVEQHGAGYVDYMWQWKDSPKIIVPKTSYVRGFKAWGWIIGTGVYIEDVEKKIEKITGHLNQIFIFILLIITILSIFILWQKLKTERAFQQSVKKYQRIFENSRDTIYRVTPDGKFLDINLAGIKLFGYSRTELMNMNVTKTYWDQSDRQKFLKEIHKKGFVEDYEINFKRKDKTKIVCLITATVQKSRDGKIISHEGMIRNISLRKQAEEKIHESEKRLELALEGTMAGIWDWNIQTGETTFNKRWAEIIGYTLEGCSLLSIDKWNDLTHPEDLKKSNMLLKKHFQGKSDYYECDLRIKHKQGYWVWVKDRGKIVDRTLDKKPLRMTGTYVDVTEHYEAEKEKEFLERQVQRSQKLETIGTLTGGIAHDFNNILTPILGYTDIIKRSLRPEDKVFNYIESIHQASMRGKALISQMLNFSRPAKGEKKGVYLENLILEALKLLRPSIPSTINIKLNINQDCGMILADASHMHQMIVNLCTNAFHAMEKSGGILTIRLEQITIDKRNTHLYSDLLTGIYNKISVIDTGYGMNEKTMDQIFDPFFTTKEVDKGTGLGLSVVHGIIKNHEGSIKVFSKPQVGTTFNIFIPNIKESIRSGEKKKDETIILGNQEMIMLVDDEPLVLDVVEEILMNLDYRVERFISSLEAFNKFKDSPLSYNLVLTDLTMPELDGMQLAAKLNSLKTHTPILLMSGYGCKINPEDQERLGIVQIIAKPILINELSIILHQILKQD
jgi:PAS domain S-box-containing protein